MPQALDNDAVVEGADTPDGLEDSAEFLEQVNLSDMERLQDQLNQAIYVSESLCALQEAMASAQDTGVSLESAQILAITTKTLLGSVGIQGNEIRALESYADSVVPGQSTQLAIESVGDKLKMIYSAIIAAIRKAKEWLIAFVYSLVGKAVQLRKKADALAATTSGLMGRPREETFQSVRLFCSLQIDGQLPADVNAEAQQALRVYTLQLKRADAMPAGARKMAEDLIATGMSNRWDPKQVRRAGELTETIVDRTSYKEQGKYAASKMLLGNYQILMKLPTTFFSINGHSLDPEREHTDVTASINMADTPHLGQMHYGKYLHASSARSEQTVLPVLASQQIRQIAMTASHMARAVEEFKATVPKLTGFADELIRIANYKHVSSYVRDDEKDNEQYKRRFLSQAPRWLLKEPAEIAQALLSTAEHLVLYATRSAAFYRSDARQATTDV